MALARVQGWVGTTGATFPTTLTSAASGSSVTAGDLLLVALMLDGQATTEPTTMTDNKGGNTWTRLSTAFLTGVGQVDIWGCVVTNGGAGMTVTAGALANTTAALVIEEWSGAAASSILDQQTSGTGTGTTASPGTTAATTNANDLIWMAVGNSATGAATVGSGFSNLTGEVSNPSKLWVQSKTVAATGTQTGSMTLPSASYEACLVAIKAAGGVTVNKGAPFLAMM